MLSAWGNRVLTLGVVTALVGGCGSGGDSTPNPSPLVLAKEPTASGDAQTGPVSQALPNNLRIVVTRDGSPQSGVTVTWSTVAGSLAPASGPTGGDGIAASSWTLGPTAGAQSAQATVAGATGSPVTFGATATAGAPPLVLAKEPTASGDAQTGLVSEALPNDLRIVVTRDGSPQSGVTVTWSTTTGSLAPTSGPTGGDGIAASSWTLGPTAGAQSAQATVAGATGSPVTFSATATAGPPPPPPNTIAITVGNIFFQSNRNGTTNTAVDTVAVNGTATWTWVSTGATPHSVQSTGTTAFTSSALKTGNGQTYQFQFTQAGTYTYNCAEHGNAMTGRIVVR